MSMAFYMRQRRKLRRLQLIELLKGACFICGSTSELEFDHIDPENKSFELSGSNLDKPMKLLLEEVKKCQLLCWRHHVQKSGEYRKSRLKHGSATMYRKYCRCDICVQGFAEYRKRFPSRKPKSPDAGAY